MAAKTRRANLSQSHTIWKQRKSTAHNGNRTINQGRTNNPKMAFPINPAIPQTAYFRKLWRIPSPDEKVQWHICGHSRALERTGFWIPELRVMLDAGVDLPTNSGARPRAVLVTHGHIDHMNSLPMLLRHSNESDPTVEIFLPGTIMHRMRQFTQLSWAVKVDDGDDLPSEYAPPPEEERSVCGPVVIADSRKKWHAATPGTSKVLQLGKKSNLNIVVHCLQLFHGRCSASGYVLCTPRGEKRVLKKHLGEGSDKRIIAERIKAAKAKGEQIHDIIPTPEIPHLAFVLDTTIQALMPKRCSTAQRILDCPVVMIECTYLEEAKENEADKRGHICWSQLLPILMQEKNALDRTHKTWVLIHFSLRYSENDIRDFFLAPDQCKANFVESSGIGEENNSRPPDVVLWLDTAPLELWLP